MGMQRHKVEHPALAVATLARALRVTAPRFRSVADGSGECRGTDEVRPLVPAGGTVRSVRSAYGRRWREHRVVQLAEMPELSHSLERRAVGLIHADEDRLRFNHARRPRARIIRARRRNERAGDGSDRVPAASEDGA